MWRVLCCTIRKTGCDRLEENNSNKQNGNHTIPSSGDQHPPGSIDFGRMGSRSEGTTPKTPTRYFIPAFQNENKRSSNPDDSSKVIFNPTSDDPFDGSTGTVYESATSLVNAESRRSNSASTATLDSTVESLASHTPAKRPVQNQEEVLVNRMEELMEKQHQQLLKALNGFTQAVITEIQAKTTEKDTNVDGTQLERDTTSIPIRESMLPPYVAVCPEVILKLSKRVATPKWKFLARWLKIPDHEIDKISVNHKEDVQEQSYQMLLWWTQSNGGGSYPVLGEALRQEYGEQLYSDYVKMVIETEGKHSLVANSQ